MNEKMVMKLLFKRFLGNYCIRYVIYFILVEYEYVLVYLVDYVWKLVGVKFFNDSGIKEGLCGG